MSWFIMKFFVIIVKIGFQLQQLILIDIFSIKIEHIEIPHWFLNIIFLHFHMKHMKSTYLCATIFLKINWVKMLCGE